MTQSLTVFLCSTYSDLSEEREGILDAIRRLQLQHDSMEFFGARADLPIETCLAEVRSSDVLVVVVGHRYGSLVPDLGVSFSEAEYREGYRLGKPCLVYIRDENVPILPKFVERDPDKLRLLEKWKGVLTTRHTVASFSNAQELAVQVAADLGRTVQALEESVRDESALPDQADELVLKELGDILADATERGLSQRIVLSALRRTVADLLAGTGRRRPVVFLSHSQRDKQVVRQFATGLQAAGIDIWLDEAELQLGDSLVQQIQRGLDSADFVAFFLSQASLDSQWARQELNAAIARQVSADRGAVVLPVLLEDADVPALLRDVMYLDLRDGDIDTGVRKLVNSIERHLLERSHTYETRTNRYYSPAQRIKEIGRLLNGRTFSELVGQLGSQEVLVGLYRNQANALVATHLHSRTRMDEMEDLWAPSEGYYGVNVDDANEGMSEMIPLPQA